jgi:hypothetical protein
VKIELKGLEEGLDEQWKRERPGHINTNTSGVTVSGERERSRESRKLKREELPAL